MRVHSFGLAAPALAAFVFLGLISTAAAAQTVYLCKPDDLMASGHWIAPEIGISHDAATGKALVDDAVIETFGKGPIEARIETDNKIRTTFTWKVKTKTGTQKATMIYRLTVQKADLSARFHAVPQGYVNSFTTGGKCKIVKR